MSSVVVGGEQAGDKDVAVAVVDNVGEGGVPSLAVKEPSNTAESLSKRSGSESSSSDSSSTS